jgi:hypothetical protein
LLEDDDRILFPGPLRIADIAGDFQPVGLTGIRQQLLRRHDITLDLRQWRIVRLTIADMMVLAHRAEAAMRGLEVLLIVRREQDRPSYADVIERLLVDLHPHEVPAPSMRCTMFQIIRKRSKRSSSPYFRVCGIWIVFPS